MTDTESPIPAESPGPTEMYVVDSPYELANWRPLVNWILFIPHGIILYVLRIVAWVVWVIYWFAFLFTGKLQPGMYGVVAMYERYNARATSFLFGFSEIYSPFDFNTGPDDNGAYPPVTLSLPTPEDPPSRAAAANFILAIPHYIVLFFLFIAAWVVAVIGWFAVLFTGAWPQGMRDFLVKVANYYYRIWVYVMMVETNYPKFGIS